MFNFFFSKQFPEIIDTFQCDIIGINIGWNDPEYLLWASLASKNKQNVRIIHVDVANDSKKVQSKYSNGNVCGILTMRGFKNMKWAPNLNNRLNYRM